MGMYDSMAEISGARSMSDIISPRDYGFKLAVGKYLGCRRNWVACSNAYASLIRAGSCQAPAMKEMPTGKPKIKPAGTVICGYPATAAGEVLSMSQLLESPSTRSISHAGLPEGTINASSLCFRIAES